jgi:predicted acetyltransferase
VMLYRQDFLDNNDTLNGCAWLEDCKNYDEWLNFDGRAKRKYGDDCVLSSTFLAIRIEDDKLVWMVNIRHKLDDFLLSYWWNIWYSVLTNERKKGYDTEILKLALIESRKLWLNKVLIACDKDNIASYKTIQANGWILENEVEDKVWLWKCGIIQRYWIYL